MPPGGPRPGAGRPKGGHNKSTLQALKYREVLVAEILKNAEPLAKALVSKGLTGDVPALKEINERSIGKVRDELDLTSGGETLGFIVLPKLNEREEC